MLYFYQTYYEIYRYTATVRISFYSVLHFCDKNIGKWGRYVKRTPEDHYESVTYD